MATLKLCMLSWLASRVLCDTEATRSTVSSAAATSSSNYRIQDHLYPGSFSINTCSPWHYYHNGECKCGKMPHEIIKCESSRATSILDCYCITYNEDGTAEAGNCIYNCGTKGHFIDEVYNFVPTNVTVVNEFMCATFNRTGTLCGKCKDGLHPLANSFDMNCIECPNGKSNWWKVLLVQFLPLTVFYFIVVLLGTNVIFSLHGFVFFSQCISMPAAARALILAVNKKHTSHFEGLVRFLGVFYGVWNLDFFRSLNLGICLGTDLIQTLAIDIAVGAYPLMLILLSYILIHIYDKNFRPLVIIWKPLRALHSKFPLNWEKKTSTIDAFSTFYFLSYAKFLSVSYDLLLPVRVYQLNPTTGHLTYSLRLFYNASTPYFGERHLPYGILATIVLTIFVIIPTLLLMLYPFRWFQKVLNLFPFRWYILHTFMDSLQGYYKDGTQPGTKDCRWFASVFFLLRFTFFVIGAITLGDMLYVLDSIVLVIVIIMLITVQPFKSHLSKYSDTIVPFLFLLLLFCAGAVGLSCAEMARHDSVLFFYGLALLVAVQPLLYLIFKLLCWINRWRRIWIQKFRHGYEVLE